MRILLMAEGGCDEVVAQELVRRSFPEALVYPKQFAARGFEVVRRSVSTLVHAAHFGFFDVLIIHFDIDSTLNSSFSSVTESQRWQQITARVSEIHNSLPDAGRPRALRTILMAPCQSVDAWLGWGSEDGDGNLWERKARKDLKRYLFGEPAINSIGKTRELIPKLIAQMSASSDWPISLREFCETLETAGLIDGE